MRMLSLAAALAAIVAGGQASAALVSVAGPTSSLGTPAAIIAAPASATDTSVTGTGMLGFNERQGVLLSSALAVDGGTIAAGLRVSSHMIFLNGDDSLTAALSHGTSQNAVQWTFSGTILGVMSDRGARLELASTALLGSPTTLYPTGNRSGSRGFELGTNPLDGYRVNGNVLDVWMSVTQPGDWIRVVTAAPVPVPAAFGFLAAGLGLLGLLARRRQRSA